MSNATLDQPIMLRLKTSTQARHDATENGDFNRELVHGRLPLDQYVESIAQLFLIHARLESHLRRHQSSLPPIASVVTDYQFQEPYLRNDLTWFHRRPGEIQPLKSTANFIAEIDRIAAERPLALLGIHYVFEGSNNGSRHIAKAIRRAYNLTGLDGTHYLDPYGEDQKPRWQAFKDAMNAQTFTEADIAAIVEAAGKTFDAVMELHRELAAEPVNKASKPVQESAQPAVSRCPFHNARA